MDVQTDAMKAAIIALNILSDENRDEILRLYGRPAATIGADEDIGMQDDVEKDDSVHSEESDPELVGVEEEDLLDEEDDNKPRKGTEEKILEIYRKTQEIWPSPQRPGEAREAWMKRNTYCPPPLKPQTVIPSNHSCWKPMSLEDQARVERVVDRVLGRFNSGSRNEEDEKLLNEYWSDWQKDQPKAQDIPPLTTYDYLYIAFLQPAVDLTVPSWYAGSTNDIMRRCYEHAVHTVGGERVGAFWTKPPRTPCRIFYIGKKGGQGIDELMETFATLQLMDAVEREYGFPSRKEVRGGFYVQNQLPDVVLDFIE